MTRPIDPISEADLLAFVDDQLTPEHRVAVEDYLSHQPVLAARVMADLRSRDELRLAMSGQMPMAKRETLEAARRLESAFMRDAYLAKFRNWAAVAALIALGWLAHVEFALHGQLGRCHRIDHAILCRRSRPRSPHRASARLNAFAKRAAKLRPRRHPLRHIDLTYPRSRSIGGCSTCRSFHPRPGRRSKLRSRPMGWARSPYLRSGRGGSM